MSTRHSVAMIIVAVGLHGTVACGPLAFHEDAGPRPFAAYDGGGSRPTRDAAVQPPARDGGDFRVPTEDAARPIDAALDAGDLDTDTGTGDAGSSEPGLPFGSKLVVDPDNPRRLARDQDRDGKLEPFFLAGVGGPEGFLYESKARQQEISAALLAHGANGIYFHSIRSPKLDGDGNGTPDGRDFEAPFKTPTDPESGVDPELLDAWAALLEPLDRAGIVSFFFLYDDHAALAGCKLPLPELERNYVTTLVERFKHLDHLIWITQEEWAFSCKDTQLAKRRQSALAAEIRKHDPFHPIGVHHMNGQAMQFEGDPNIKVYAQQTGNDDGLKAGAANAVQLMHDRAGGKATANSVYIMAEAHTYHLDLIHARDRRELRRSYWATAMSGGYLLVYNAYECNEQAKLCSQPGAADAHDPTPEMLDDLGRLQEFLSSIPYNQLEPADALALSGTQWVLADASGTRLLGYTDSSVKTLGFKAIKPGAYTLRWFDPVTGKESIESKNVPAGDTLFEKPAGFGAETAVFVEPS